MSFLDFLLSSALTFNHLGSAPIENGSLPWREQGFLGLRGVLLTLLSPSSLSTKLAHRGCRVSLLHWPLGKRNQKVLKDHQMRCGKVLSSYQILPVLWMTAIQKPRDLLAPPPLSRKLGWMLIAEASCYSWAHALRFQHSRGN